MTKKIKGMLSGVIAVVVASTAVGYSVFTKDEMVASAVNEKDAKTIEDTINQSVKSTKTGEDKEETVYVISDASGNVEKTIVSDWLKNKKGSDTITDKTNLNNIVNVKSYADYTEGKDGEIIWNADGEDIYYQGETDKDLPVDVKLTYILDGKEITPSELAGKSGKVTIRFEYTNNQTEMVKINGKEERMYVPFTMISGVILDSSRFRNVEVNSGKVITDGDRFIVIGLGFPGMDENLKISELLKDTDIEMPENVEITADVEDFELSVTLTMGSADLISGISTEDLESVDELEDAINKLVSATDELKSGTARVKEGLSELNTSFAEYKNGVNSLAEGITQIHGGVSELNNNTGAFVSGLSELSAGADAIINGLEGEKGAVNGSKELAEGAGQLDEGIASLQTKSGDLVNGVAQINDGAAGIETNMQTVLSAFKDNADTGSYGLTNGSEAVSQGVNQVVSQITGMISQMQQSIEDNNGKMAELQRVLQGGVNPVTGRTLTQEEIETYKAQLNQLGGANAALNQMLTQMNVESTGEQLATLQQGASDLSTGVKTLETGLVQLESEGTAPLAAGTAQLNDKMPELVGGIAQLKEGTGKVAAGAGALAVGISSLDDGIANSLKPGIEKLYQAGILFQTGISTLYEGTTAANNGGAALNAGTVKVSEGISKLYDGSVTLDDGMQQFKDEAIGKVNELTGGVLKEETERIKEVVKLANDYTIFSDAAEGKSTSVKFIYETTGITK